MQTKSIPGVPAEGWFAVEFRAQVGRFDDGSSYELLAPSYTAHDLAFGPLEPGTLLSVRVAPPMTGLGLLSAIDHADLAALADPEDRDGDGISGRFNPLEGLAAGALGRFGWKANQPDLVHQTAAAFLGDIGITSPLMPVDDCPAPQTACAAAGGELDIDAARFGGPRGQPPRPRSDRSGVSYSAIVGSRCDRSGLGAYATLP